MGVPSQNGQSPSLGVLLRELAEGSSALIRQELRLAQLELGELLGAIASGTTYIIGGSVLVLLGVLSTTYSRFIS